jgi:hypothetical protein
LGLQQLGFQRARDDLRNENPAPIRLAADVNTVFEWAYMGIGNAEFGPLLQLILDAERE